MLLAPAGFAHPMGNFSINHYARITVQDGHVDLLYLIDRAEIPTYQEMQDTGIAAKEGDASLPPYLHRQAATLGKGLLLEVNGEALTLQAVSQSVLFPPGAGGLPTMKLGLLYRARFHRQGDKLTLHYADNNFPGHAGWKEILLSGAPGAVLEGPLAHNADRSDQLSNYPTSLVSSPPQDVEASVTVTLPAMAAKPAPAPAVAATTAAPAAPPHKPSAAASVKQPEDVLSSPPAAALTMKANQQATPRSRFTELMTEKHLSFWFLLSAALIAAGLGALHALEPGHGKTIVAAYLVGSRGTARHAVALGALVTASHTAGVYLLGAVVLYASAYIVPERIYPWLSVVSGLAIAVLAAYMLLRAWTGEDGDHAHEAGKPHSDWQAGIRVPQQPEISKLSSVEEKNISLKQMLTLGITGGIIPCPAALVVLLSAVALHRILFGLFLIVSFSMGLAGVLIGIGLMMVRAQRLFARFSGEGAWARRYLPMLSSGVMLLAGLAITVSAFSGAVPLFNLSALFHHRAGSFAAIVLLGLFLGMRHSTDPDHVVAVSTIVTRERSVKQGALIGMLWGFGHTITIFLVGAGIILFDLVIPPRIGLSMEFSVACMLVLLGVLNLTGTLQKWTRRWSPVQWQSAENQADEAAQLSAASRVKRLGWFHVLRPLFIGLVHGLAGSAAVALLVLSMIHNSTWAVMYLVVFGFGTVIGMMLMTTVMAVPLALTGKSVSGYLTVASGLISVSFGLFLMYHLGYVDGLFGASPHWTPE